MKVRYVVLMAIFSFSISLHAQEEVLHEDPSPSIERGKKAKKENFGQKVSEEAKLMKDKEEKKGGMKSFVQENKVKKEKKFKKEKIKGSKASAQ